MSQCKIGARNQPGGMPIDWGSALLLQLAKKNCVNLACIMCTIMRLALVLDALW